MVDPSLWPVGRAGATSRLDWASVRVGSSGGSSEPWFGRNALKASSADVILVLHAWQRLVFRIPCAHCHLYGGGQDRMYDRELQRLAQLPTSLHAPRLISLSNALSATSRGGRSFCLDCSLGELFETHTKPNGTLQFPLQK